MSPSSGRCRLELSLQPEPSEVIPMIKRHEVHLLLEAGLSHRETAIQADLSERSVDRIAHEAAPTTMLDDVAAVRQRAIGRPSLARTVESTVRDILTAEPDLPTVEILHRVRGQGFTGGKSGLYALVASLRPRVVRPVMVRFEGVAGEFAQFDFGQAEVTYASGQRVRLHFAAYRLKYSRWVHVEVVPNEQVESLCRALLNAFAASAGVPLAVVFDNPKTVVIHPRRIPVVWNRTLAQLALDFSFAIELCTPRAAQQKGAVENLVGWAKGSFFKVRRFLDPADLFQQLAAWHIEVNEERASRATGIIPTIRLLEEQPRLKPLIVAPPDYGLHFDEVVGPTGMVTHRSIRYAMPPETIGLPATLQVYPDRVRITAGSHTVMHPRFPDGGQLSYPPALRAQHLATIAGTRGRLYFQRQRLLELGPVAVHYLTEIVHRRPRTWKSDVEQLYTLLEDVGGTRLTAAMHSAQLRALFGVEYVRTFLATRSNQEQGPV